MCTCPPVYLLVRRFPAQTSRNRGGELGGGVHVLFMLLLVGDETACIHDRLSAIGRPGSGLCFACFVSETRPSQAVTACSCVLGAGGFMESTAI